MEVSQNLTELLDATPIDEARALSVIDQVHEAEAEIKRANLSALIRIKNALTQEQRDQLTELRSPRLRFLRGFGGYFSRDTTTAGLPPVN